MCLPPVADFCRIMDEFRANGRDSPLEEPPDSVSLSPHRQPARPDWELRGVLWSRYWQVCRDYSATYNSGATYRPADRVCGESAHHGGLPASDGRPAINGRGEGLARSALGERPDLPLHRPPRGGRSAARKRSKQPNHCVFCKNNNELPCVYRSHILKLYGVDTRWFRSYLADHYQRVQLQSAGQSLRRTISRPLLNPIGTFQVSALGPLLHNVYANDLPLYIDESTSTIAYADDVQLYVSGPPRDIVRLTESLEDSLTSLSNWYGKNGLKINAAKTQLIVLGTREMTRRLPPISINFSGSTIASSSTVKNLGVHVDGGWPGRREGRDGLAEQMEQMKQMHVGQMESQRQAMWVSLAMAVDPWYEP
ncbi:hypothetical protein FJT64_019292 [Amphibalanus amphitrite]|uniref:Reverse transcriptase domain-containing protein n=1 Tax=Amphibalanus amphitrite TaxID=1232801 RepID=A0A6A4WS53_AMPAM|nr:hypothetical protein FJT64_019292 [Amphibalanus amphitrite]